MASATTGWLTPRTIERAVKEGANDFQLNRPGGLDLESFAANFGFTYGIVWRPVYGGGTDRLGCYIQKDGVDLPERLKVDALRSFGDFATASAQHKFVGWSKPAYPVEGGDGKEAPGSSLPALAFERRDFAFLPNLQDEAKSDDQRQALAKEHGIRGCFAFFRDGAVFEFGSTEVLDQENILPIMGQFGGTRGPVVEDASSLDKRANVKWSRKSSMPNGLAVPA